MTISALQQQAFIASPTFNEQVNVVVKQQALVKSTANPGYVDTVLANVLRQPQSYGFVSTILADPGWAVTYDAWATDPASADYGILVGVQTWFGLLTGWLPPVVEGASVQTTGSVSMMETEPDSELDVPPEDTAEEK